MATHSFRSTRLRSFRKVFTRRPHLRMGMLGVAAAVCLLATAWVSWEMATAAYERLDQRFHRIARERSERIVGAFEEPVRQLVVLQRVFQSAGEIEPAVFEAFVEPMLLQAGVSGYAWAPRVEEKARAGFEAARRALWGENFAVREVDAEGHAVTAVPRPRYFPVYYAVSGPQVAQDPGCDLAFPEERRALPARRGPSPSRRCSP